MMLNISLQQTTIAGRGMTPEAQSECQGLLVVLVGPAGVGKNTVMHRAIEAIPRLRQMPTATTRPPREGEQNGREHWFVSMEAFQHLITDNALVEHQEVYPGKFYGTPRQQIEAALLHDREWLIADIDITGAANLRAAFPRSAVLIFIEPPDLATLDARMHARGQETEEEIQIRLARAPHELEFAAQCDYRILNTNLERAADQVIDIVRNEAERHGCV
ncbi:MAG: guanylate kinase [Aggregatilineales bacterium]